MSAQSSTNQVSNSNFNQSGTSQTSPWGVQAPYLTQAFQNAGNNLDLSQAFTPDQLKLYSSMLGAYQSPMFQGAASSSANAGSTLSGAGANGAANGLYGLAGFSPSATNNTDALIGGTNRFVQGANIPGQVAAGMIPAEQAAMYGLSPSIDRNAAADGAQNGSRAAIEHGLLASNLAQDATGLANQLYGSEYNTGAGLTESQLASNNQNALAALEGLTNGGIGAANAGTGANASSIENLANLFGLSSQGASGQNNDPFQALQNFYNIIGSHNWGNTTSNQSHGSQSGTSTTNYNPSTMSQIGAWTNLVGSLF